MENRIVKERLQKLREKMRENEIDYYLIPSSDYHNSEYAAEFFQARAYFSGFTGSNGTLLVSASEAGLWTDGRYFVQAEKQLAGTGVTLFRMMEPGVPTIIEYLSTHMEPGEALGFDGLTLAAETGVEFARQLQSKAVVFKYGQDLAGEVWTDRPPIPCNKAYVLDVSYAGKSCADKLSDVREKMRAFGTEVFFLSKLDDIMWLLNLRGSDIACNPVALSHLLLTLEHGYLFIQPEAVTDEVRAHCQENGITIMSYHNTAQHISGYAPTGDVLFDRANVSYTMFMVLRQITTPRKRKLINRPNPTAMMKACKNKVELEHTRKTYLTDSAELVKFIYWLKQNAGKVPMTEVDATEKLDGMRAALPGFIDLSFDTISGYKENAAIVHYHAEKETAAEIRAEGMLLVDSGATYMGGTTDVTRTIVLGEISDEIKRTYTAVCCGMLRLSHARFPYGCSGKNLDVLARQPLWDMGLDYNHGTGHGVGYMLNVHEGPQNIRWRLAPDAIDAALEEGMLVSNEPGVYIEGQYGVRIENILEVARDEETDGRFLKFATLTYAPIDLEAIDTRYMSIADVEALNDYHAEVYEKIAPLIDEQTVRDWLKKVTTPVKKSIMKKPEMCDNSRVF